MNRKSFYLFALITMGLFSYSVNVSGEFDGTVLINGSEEFAHEDENAKIVANEMAAMQHEQDYLSTLTRKYQFKLKAFTSKENGDRELTDKVLQDSLSNLQHLKSVVKKQYDLFDTINNSANILSSITNTSTLTELQNSTGEARKKLKNTAKYLVDMENLVNNQMKVYNGLYRKEEIKQLGEKYKFKYDETLSKLTKSFSDFYITSESISKLMHESLRDEVIQEITLLQRIKNSNAMLKKQLDYKLKGAKIEDKYAKSEFEKKHEIENENDKYTKKQGKNNKPKTKKKVKKNKY